MNIAAEFFISTTDFPDAGADVFSIGFNALGLAAEAIFIGFEAQNADAEPFWCGVDAPAYGLIFFASTL